jgi:hypothetical protein
LTAIGKLPEATGRDRYMSGFSFRLGDFFSAPALKRGGFPKDCPVFCKLPAAAFLPIA